VEDIYKVSLSVALLQGENPDEFPFLLRILLLIFQPYFSATRAWVVRLDTFFLTSLLNYDSLFLFIRAYVLINGIPKIICPGI
jgi:hypothetical protein